MRLEGRGLEGGVAGRQEGWNDSLGNKRNGGPPRIKRMPFKRISLVSQKNPRDRLVRLRQMGGHGAFGMTLSFWIYMLSFLPILTLL